MRFTDSKIKSIKPSDSRKIVWEGGGTCLGIRVSPSGRKSFIFMYRFEGKARMMTVGKYPELPLASARIRVAKARKKITEGIDPGSVMVQTKAADRSAPTIKNLAEEYIEKWAKPRKRSWKEDERILFKDVISAWGRRKAKDITRRDVVVLLDSIADRGAKIQANRTLAVIRKMFNFALSRSILESSPCVAIVAPAKENRRDRVLDEKEIKTFWFGLEQASMSKGIQLALKLQLVTAQRKGEVAGAEWKDFDLEKGWWTIPGEKAKNGVSHRIPLTSLALNIIEEIKKLAGESNWLFPSPRGNGHITEPAIDHAVRNNSKEFSIDHFTPHDLRRTAASHMTSIGVSRLTVSKLLNHVESGVTAVYDRHSYDKEKRQALDSWSRKLENILFDKKGKLLHLKKK
jgi:integrase